MALFATQYPNNSRTVIGTPVVFNDDSILLCDTALAPVTINLLEIPNGYWNTPWKLYVIDKSNNASVNNITINAGAGQTINGASSITLSVNSECALIRIIGDSQYVAQISASGATIGGHIIQDEGVSLTQRPYLNFIGSGVVASDNAITGKTDVTINGGVITVTYAQLTTLANTNALIPSTDYLITDAEFGSTPIIPTNVVVTAITTNKVSLTGQGIFFNADYQGVGNYSGIPTYNSNVGVWVSTLPVVLGDVCIWSNLMYVNITGANGVTNPASDIVNWQVIPYSITKGYILEVDAIEYQQSTNWILTRTDNRLNTVERAVPGTFNSLNRFPWGSDLATFNSVVKYSCFDICNSIIKNAVFGNILNGTDFTLGAINEPCAVGSVSQNVLTNVAASVIYANKTFNQNVISNTTLTIDYNNGSIQGNNIFLGTVNLGTNDGFIEFNDINSSNINVLTNSAAGIVSYNVLSTSTLTISISNNSEISYNHILSDSSLTIGTNNGLISKFVPKEGANVIEENSQVIFETNNGLVAGNTIRSYCYVNISLNSVGFVSNTWNHVSFILSTNNLSVGLTTANFAAFTGTALTKQINAGTCDYGINTIGYDLDCSDPAIFDAFTNTLTIPLTIANFFGFYILKNAGGLTIDKIVNLSGKWETTFVNDAGTTTFNSVAVGGAVVDEIVSNGGLTSFAIVYRINGTDSIKLRLLGNLCGVTQTSIYI